MILTDMFGAYQTVQSARVQNDAVTLMCPRHTVAMVQSVRLSVCPMDL